MRGSTLRTLDKAKLGDDLRIVTCVCATCGFRSDTASFFRREKGGAFGISRMICAGCERYRLSTGERRILRAFIITHALWLAGFALYAGSGALESRLPVFLFVEALVLSAPLRVITHEAGHALMARAMGAEVPRVVIGFGPVARTWRLGRVRVEVGRYLLLSGLTQYHFPGGARRWQDILVLLAGAAANLGAGVAVLSAGHALAELFRPGVADMVASIVGGIGICQLLGLSNLAPSDSVLDGTPSDGRQIGRLLFHRRETPAAWIEPTTLGLVVLSQNRFAEAAELFTHAANLNPGSPAILACILHSLEHSQGPDAALEFYHERQAEMETAMACNDPNERGAVAMLRANIAWVALTASLPDPPLAEACSLAAVEAQPEYAAALAARGSVLLARGERDAAQPMLLRSLRGSQAAVDRAVIAGELARAEQAGGDASAAAAFAELRRYAESLP